MSPNRQTPLPWLTGDVWGLEEMVRDPAFSRHQSEMHQPGQEEQIQRAISTLVVVVHVGDCLSKTVSMDTGSGQYLSSVPTDPVVACPTGGG